MKKYMLHPGWVISITDGDRHYISAQQLCSLYEVSLSECVIYKGDIGYSMTDWKKFIHLRPRSNGKYNLLEI